MESFQTGPFQVRIRTCEELHTGKFMPLPSLTEAKGRQHRPELCTRSQCLCQPDRESHAPDASVHESSAAHRTQNCTGETQWEQRGVPVPALCGSFCKPEVYTCSLYPHPKQPGCLTFLACLYTGDPFHAYFPAKNRKHPSGRKYSARRVCSAWRGGCRTLLSGQFPGSLENEFSGGGLAVFAGDCDDELEEVCTLAGCCFLQNSRK